MTYVCCRQRIAISQRIAATCGASLRGAGTRDLRCDACTDAAPHSWCAVAVRAAGTATAEEAGAAVRMLQNMGDDKIKEEVTALTARSEAPPIALVTAFPPARSMSIRLAACALAA